MLVGSLTGDMKAEELECTSVAEAPMETWRQAVARLKYEILQCVSILRCISEKHTLVQEFYNKLPMLT